MKRLDFRMPSNYLVSWYSYEPSEWMLLAEGFIVAVRRVISDALARAYKT